jgi:hypothetical protein
VICCTLFSLPAFIERLRQIVLTPVKIQRADAVRAKLAALDINEQDIIDAVAWARETNSDVK